MAYGILVRHGARITVDSEEGRGTTFRLDFPVAEALPAARGSEPAPAVAPAGLRCLVVDDEEAVAEVLGDMLASVGHRADVVSSGAEAITRFQAKRFDVVFTDLAMPGMNGWQVARAVKAASRPAPVVLVTGFGVEVSTHDLRTNGVDSVLAKPLRLVDIHRALASLRAGATGASGGGARP
jgi:CheY-like chemotaxis protein